MENTNRVAAFGGITHAATHVRIDGKDKALDEKAAVKLSGIEVDRLRLVIHRGLTGYGQACDVTSVFAAQKLATLGKSEDRRA